MPRMMLNLIIIVQKTLGSLATYGMLRNHVSISWRADSRKRCRRLSLVISLLQRASVSRYFIFYVRRTNGFMEWELYGASGCNLLEKAILSPRFVYWNCLLSLYQSQQVRWERHTLSVLGPFIPCHLRCCYNLLETVLDTMLVHIHPKIEQLDVCHGFRFEQEEIFSCKSGALIEDGDKYL